MNDKIIFYTKYAVKKNCNKQISTEFYSEIIENYNNLCEFVNNNTFDEFDEFYKIACLLLSIKANTIIEDDNLTNNIACDASIKMCEEKLELEGYLTDCDTNKTKYRQKILDMLSNEELVLSIEDLSKYFVVIYNDLKQNKTFKKRFKFFNVF